MPLDLLSGPPAERGARREQRERDVLRDLCGLADRAGVEVRIEPFELQLAGKGGLCRIAGQATVLVDARLSVVDQIGVIGEALGALGLASQAPPELASYLRTGHEAVRSLARLRP